MAVLTKEIKNTRPLAETIKREDGTECTKGFLTVIEPIRNDLLLFSAPFSIFIRTPLTVKEIEDLNNLANSYNRQLNDWFYAFERQNKPLYVPDREKFFSLYQTALNDTSGKYGPEQLKNDFESTLKDCIAKNYETARDCRFVQRMSKNPITGQMGRSK